MERGGSIVLASAGCVMVELSTIVAAEAVGPGGSPTVTIPLLLLLLLLLTSGQSNLTKGRIAAAHGWCNCIQQVAQCAPPPNTILGPLEYQSQTASRSVQPLLQGSRQSVPILYNGPPISAKLPLPMGQAGSCVNMLSFSAKLSKFLLLLVLVLVG